MLRISTFVVEGLLTHAASPAGSRAVIEQLVESIASGHPGHNPP
ncbi:MULTISPECIES: hypothetical protein [unclassified Rhodococcus (in: high G+C Gram-positive bacteria)]|nr:MULTISPECIES: hypothetical protein [unclassified Rhodococcus (in: high G+C Gram-positive bacteria)]